VTNVQLRWKLVESLRIGVGGAGQCKLGLLPRRHSEQNRPDFGSKVQKTLPLGEFCSFNR